jgi:tRNA-specific adenosine deaminase 1
VLNEVHTLVEYSAYESRYIERSDDATPADSVSMTYNSYFAFNPDISFHLFTTEAPCGDASLELLMATKAPEEAVPWLLPTKQRDDQSTDFLPGRGWFSQLGIVRRKPSRADSEATMSKSCTDKLTMKQFTGMLSFPAYAFVQASTNSFIKTLVVYSHQYHAVGYERAFGAGGRLAPIAKHGHLVQVSVLPDSFPDFEYSRAATGPGSKTSNISALWILVRSNESSGIAEVLHNGVKEGYKQFEARPGKASIVCRRSLWMMGQKIASLRSRPEKMSSDEKAPTLKDVACPLDSEMISYRKTKDKLAPRRQDHSKRIVIECLPGWKSITVDDAWSL